jgi:hypothetical protein
MGTDIHGRVEYRYSPEDNYFAGESIEDSRNYRVFAMLAGVRNGYGVAGCPTHTPVQPISEPRGLPEGVEDDDCETWFGDHSFSWVTLKEVLDWPGWNQTLHRTGIVSREEYERLMSCGGGCPESWCGGISGPGVKTAESAEECDDWTHVRYEWTQPFADTVGVFRKWIEYLDAKYGYLLADDPAAVRLVFGFDS